MAVNVTKWPEGWTRGDLRRVRPDQEPTAVLAPGTAGSTGASGPSRTAAATRAGRSTGTSGSTGTTRDAAESAAADQWQPTTHRSRRRVGRIVALILAGLLVLLVGGYFFLDARLNRIVELSDYSGRPAATPGRDWLLVGSDSRAGLSASERRRLSTGSAGGQRTDTMMLLHIPSGGGKPTLISLPRDSYVPIPGHGRNKLNAAYAFGGPKLLQQTVETVTGIRIDHYMEIGFGGFVGVVDAVGGVHLCVKESIDDPKAGLDIKAGCQDLNGGEALGYVRTRATARADLDRVQRQREFLGAVLDKAASPGTLLNPFRSVPLALSASDAVAVDNGTHLFDLFRLGLAMRGDPLTLTVPVAGTPTLSGVGSVVEWDRANALRLFNALQADEPVPSDLVSGQS
jgi:LCP family protein required for cell wall assembly